MTEYESSADIQRLNTLMARINLANKLPGFRKKRWSSIPEYPIFYSLIAIYDIDNVIECGTNAGASALSFAAGLRNTGKPGKVYTWDIDEIQGIDKETNLEDRIIRHLQPFIESKINISGRLLIFIDGDHSYESCLGDLRHAETFVKIGDIIVIHDTFKAPPVKDAIKTFLKDNPRPFIEIPSSAGIGVIKW